MQNLRSVRSATLALLAFSVFLSSCSTMFQEREHTSLPGEGNFRFGTTTGIIPRPEFEDSNYPPTNNPDSSIGQLLHGEYGLGENNAIDATLGHSIVTSAINVRYRQRLWNAEEWASVISAGPFYNEYSHSDFTHAYDVSPTRRDSIHRASAEVFGLVLSNSFGMKFGKGSEFYFGPKIYYVDMTGTYDSLAFGSQKFSFDGFVYGGFSERRSGSGRGGHSTSCSTCRPASTACARTSRPRAARSAPRSLRA